MILTMNVAFQNVGRILLKKISEKVTDRKRKKKENKKKYITKVTTTTKEITGNY